MKNHATCSGVNDYHASFFTFWKLFPLQSTRFSFLLSKHRHTQSQTDAERHNTEPMAQTHDPRAFTTTTNTQHATHTQPPSPSSLLSPPTTSTHKKRTYKMHLTDNTHRQTKHTHTHTTHATTHANTTEHVQTTVIIGQKLQYRNVFSTQINESFTETCFSVENDMIRASV